MKQSRKPGSDPASASILSDLGEEEEKKRKEEKEEHRLLVSHP